MTAGTIGTRIAQRRAALGLSQRALAGLVEADAGQLGHWETGRRNPGHHVLPVLAGALDVTAEWLATGEKPPAPDFMPAIPFHPLANLFPLMTGPEFDALVADMKANGFRSGEEIVIHEGMILDGRNRARCAIAAGIITADADPKTEWIFSEFSIDGIDSLVTDAEVEAGPLAFVLAKNLHRRHLSASQRAMVAAKIADLPRGRRQSNPPNGGITAAQAAKTLNVGTRTVERARQVVETAEPEVVQAVTDGRLPVATATDIATLPPERQREIIKAADPKVLAKVVAEARAEKTAAKKVRRAEREAGMAAKVLALPEKRFGVIYADPEWRFEPRSRKTGLDRAADNHYPTSDLEMIKSRLETAFSYDIRGPDCALFLWATVPMLPQAMEVMDAWGFAYVSHWAWVKFRPGTGYWNRNNHELLLLGTRGHPVAPAPGSQRKSAIEAAIGKHSEKPEMFARLIEAYFPTVPKIELNARAARPGWTCVIHDPDAGSKVVGPDGEKVEAG